MGCVDGPGVGYRADVRECACGHLKVSHRADGCVAVVLGRLESPKVVARCPCGQYEEKP
jgi:hypothetical protein